MWVLPGLASLETRKISFVNCSPIKPTKTLASGHVLFRSSARSDLVSMQLGCTLPILSCDLRDDLSEQKEFTLTRDPALYA